MKTFVIREDESTSFEEVPMPQYNECQALVKVLACGMCGTDVKLLHKSFKGFPASSYPLMLGHEGIGEVVAVGKKVKSFQIGDRVLLPFLDAEDVKRPDLNSAWGALSEYALVCDVEAYPEGEAPDCAYAQSVIGKDIDAVDAVMIITFREVLSCIKYVGVDSEESVVVFGCGPVGLTYIKMLSLLGVKNIIACDIMEDKLEQARTAGARYVFNNKKEDIQKTIRELYPDGVDYVWDAAGSQNIVNQGIKLIKDRGKIVCYGISGQESITIDFKQADYNWQLIYQQMPKKKEEGSVHDQIMDWIYTGKLCLKEFISDYFQFENASDAYQKLINREIHKKGIIVMQ